MSYTLVRSSVITATNVFAGTSTYAFSYPAAYTNGNLLVIGVVQETRTVTGIAGATLTYTGDSTLNAAAGVSASLFTAIGNGSGDTTATITLSGSYNSTNTDIVFMEFSGAQSDQSGNTVAGSSTDAATAHNCPSPSGTITPPTAENVVLSMVYISGGTWTRDTSFTTIAGTASTVEAGYLIQSAATAQSYNGTTDVNRYSAIRIKACAGASAGGTSVPVFVHQLKQQGIA